MVLGSSARSTRAETSPGSARAILHMADLSTPEGNRGMIDACVRVFGRLDVLVNNAGRAEVASVLESTPELVERVFRINALGPAWAMHFAWPHLMSAAARGGRPAIVNVSSIATVDPFPGFFAYGASKAALNLLTQSAAKEGAGGVGGVGGVGVGVRAFCVAPGAVETPMLRSAFSELQVPREETLTPEAVARVIVECVGGKHDALVGRLIPVLPENAKAWYREWVRDHPAVEPFPRRE